MDDLRNEYGNICAMIGDKERVILSLRNDITKLHIQADELAKKINETNKEKEDERNTASPK